MEPSSDLRITEEQGGPLGKNHPLSGSLAQKDPDPRVVPNLPEPKGL